MAFQRERWWEAVPWLVHGRWIYVLAFVIGTASCVLAVWGWRYAQGIERGRKQASLETMHELAAEKVAGIEYDAVKGEKRIFNTIDLSDRTSIRDVLNGEQLPILSILILSNEGKPVADGFFTKRQKPKEFLEKVLKDIVPMLNLEEVDWGERKSIHIRTLEGEQLYAVTKRYHDGKSYYVLLEEDLRFWIAEVFPQYFRSRARHVYQIVDEFGQIVYGPNVALSGIPTWATTELEFLTTVTRWKVRVTDRDAPKEESRSVIVNAALIGISLLVVFGGLVAALVTVRRERMVNEAKDLFVQNISHELKTPLAIISMFGELLQGRLSQGEKEKNYADTIVNESRRLAGMVDNLLDFSRTEQAAGDLRFERFELCDALEQAVGWLRPALEKENVVVEILAEAELSIVADRRSVVLAVTNLIDNAMKYAAGGGRIHIDCTESEKEWVLSVRDFGGGVQDSEKKQLFKRFYRGRSLQGPPIRGSGIGLAIVAGVAAAHGGRAWVMDGNPGAVFLFSISKNGSEEAS